MSKPTLKGFTLIEVLISIFVLSIGVLGTAGMQLIALRTSQQSAFQTTALQLASEMADKMRTNSSRMKASDKENQFLGIDYRSAAGDPPAPGMMCYGTASVCSAEELAKFDIYEWEKRIKTFLPKGRALVCRDAEPWDSDVGAYRWACNASAATAASLVIKLGWQEKNPDGSLIKNASNEFPPGVVVVVAPYLK